MYIGISFFLLQRFQGHLFYKVVVLTFEVLQEVANMYKVGIRYQVG